MQTGTYFWKATYQAHTKLRTNAARPFQISEVWENLFWIQIYYTWSVEEEREENNLPETLRYNKRDIMHKEESNERKGWIKLSTDAEQTQRKLSFNAQTVSVGQGKGNVVMQHNSNRRQFQGAWQTFEL